MSPSGGARPPVLPGWPWSSWVSHCSLYAAGNVSHSHNVTQTTLQNIVDILIPYLTHLWVSTDQRHGFVFSSVFTGLKKAIGLTEYLYNKCRSTYVYYKISWPLNKVSKTGTLTPLHSDRKFRPRGWALSIKVLWLFYRGGIICCHQKLSGEFVSVLAGNKLTENSKMRGRDFPCI